MNCSNCGYPQTHCVKAIKTILAHFTKQNEQINCYKEQLESYEKYHNTKTRLVKELNPIFQT